MSKKKGYGVAALVPGDYIPSSEASIAPQWTTEQLLAVKHLGPAIIGQEMYEASQSLALRTNDGVFGPAILGEIPEAYRDQRPGAA